jgi:hypothetical protein
MSTWLPPYTEREHPADADAEASASVASDPLSPASTTTASVPSPSSSAVSLPLYSDAVGDDVFAPTAAFHIRAEGRGMLGFGLPPAPDPIAIFAADPSAITATAASVNFSATPAYVSMRRLRSSGSCWLVRGDDPTQKPLCSTLYKLGVGRAPHIRILGDVPADAFAGPSAYPTSQIDAIDWATPYQHDMEVRRVSLMSRAQVIRSPYGLFRWRYASRKERAEHPAPCTPDSLLVLEKLTVIADASASSSSPHSPSSEPPSSPFGKMKGRPKAEVLAARVAELVRSDDTRTPGSKRCTAGNGGLLRMDLREWIGVDGDDKRRQDGRMRAEEEVRVFVLAGAVLMLKKEVDRRRAQQAGIMAGVVIS